MATIRKAKGFTQESLAEETGGKVSESQVARIERGELNTGIATVFELLKVLKVDATELFK